MSKFKVGDRVRFTQDRFYGGFAYAKLGSEHTVRALDNSGDPILESDALDDTVGWQQDFLELVTPAAPAITPLDDAGRAALKAGDRVLVEAVFRGVDDDGEAVLNTARAGPFQTYAPPRAIYALLPPVPKPIAAGDTVRQARPKLHGVAFEVLASVDGHLLLRDQRDGHVSTGEAKDFEVVS